MNRWIHSESIAEFPRIEESDELKTALLVSQLVAVLYLQISVTDRSYPYNCTEDSNASSLTLCDFVGFVASERPSTVPITIQ
ncbi:unnamed protein product [Cercopithifilaria johnstoni]|uniref:Uncharacterized protein n=1 Tax=Cercopithifilaria johnstoni TaxID=2874296 RepID=A0A8J2MNJ3_9BILA|nr:unnamed protein product [Cercopithifilaria johnstoni]